MAWSGPVSRGSEPSCHSRRPFLTNVSWRIQPPEKDTQFAHRQLQLFCNICVDAAPSATNSRMVGQRDYGWVAGYSGRTPTPDRIFPIAMVVRVAHWRAKTECCQHFVNRVSILER
jgi:hypothetical protein